MRKSKWINDICWIRQPLLCALTLQYFSFHSLPLQGCCSYHCVLYQVPLLQKIPNCWPLCSCSAWALQEWLNATAQRAQVCQPVPPWLPQALSQARGAAGSTAQAHYHQRVTQCNTTLSDLEEKFTFIRAKHKGLVLIFCFNSHL